MGSLGGFPLVIKMIEQQKYDRSVERGDADEVARIILSETGTLVYATPMFRSLFSISEQEEASIKASDILNFADPVEDISQLPAGEHVLLPNTHEESLTFQFDWIKGRDGRRYLVGSHITDDKPQASTLPEYLLKYVPIFRFDSLERSGDLPLFPGVLDDVMVVAKPSGEILRTNEQFYRFFSLSRIDKPVSLQTLLNVDMDVLQGTRFETPLKDQSGQTCWILWSANTDEDGLVFYRGRDVTDLKIQTLALEQREKQLLQAESIGRMGHWRWVIGKTAVEWSQEIYRIFGVDQKFKPTLQNMNAMVHRRDIARVNQAFQRAIIEQNDYDMDFRITRPDGDVRHIRCEGRCALNDDGEVTALYGIMQDMTERVLYEEDLKQAKESAERAYAAKSQFLANMSHELRTPLNAIIGFSEIIQKEVMGPIGNKKYMEYIDGIHESGHHLLDLIGDILDMSKIEAGKYELDLEKIQVADIMQAGVRTMRERAREAGVSLDTKGPDNPDLTIVADRRALMQIILNLVSNSVKFTETGGSVTIECLEREEYVVFKIHDTGIGIPANKLANITQPFEQVSSSYTREHDGSGLGLAITKELTEMHGGALSIESSVGIGTTVTVRLPR